MYAFANANALQASLEEVGISYVWARVLAPSSNVRDVQKSADRNASVEKRQREQLSNDFADAYQAMLDDLDESVRTEIQDGLEGNAALLCVERLAEACHRSLTATWLAELSGSETTEVKHLFPPELLIL
jgi:uncharacterized protein (DUF488 family)